MPRELKVDALIIGAGPAGSAAAIALASAGADVALVDRYEFPRDKACGDALIPDSIRALDRLRLKDAVFARARVLAGIRVYAPSRRYVEIAGECACLPRYLLDDIIRCEAVRQGARFLPRLRPLSPVVERGMVAGARFATSAGAPSLIRSDVTLLATGANAAPLRLFGVCERIDPSAIAARLSVRTDESFSARFDHLCISYDEAVCPGYGWIFPGPGHTFNVGAGVYYDSGPLAPVTNLRSLLDRFRTRFPPAADVFAHAREVGTLRGAPLRTALAGASLSRPGLLVLGEAAGLTYSFSGEGIGKAIESGVLAAEAVAAFPGSLREHANDIASRYASTIRSAFAARFRAYKTAQDWLSRPVIANAVAWRASRSRFVQRQLQGIFLETADPRELFSPTGLLRALVS